MFVGKQFDIVLGVDIHIVQPPGPVPPLPIPHPFIGMVYDPMEFVPILGASILSNGIPRAQAGTTVKATVPHIPIGGVFVKPPSNDGELFMGSISVPSEGEPFSFLGCPVLTCQDAGMVSIPRPNRKSKSKPKSLVLPMSVLLPVPKGGQNFTPTGVTISLLGIAIKALGGALKKYGKKKKRPKWRTSEKDASKKFKRHKEQKSFKKKKEVPYGTKGSSRPDLHKKGHSVEVKNYDITSKEGKKRLVDNVTGQYHQRVKDLPKGTKQTVILDIRGQKLSGKDLTDVHNQIKAGTNNNMQVLFMH